LVFLRLKAICKL